MCRNIRRLDNLAPPVTDQEIYDAALQFVRKISGSRKPSKANVELFEQAVADVAATSKHLLKNWSSTTPPRDREVEKEKARERARKRFGE